MSDVQNLINAGDKNDGTALQAGQALSSEFVRDKPDQRMLQSRLQDLASGKVPDAVPLPGDNESKSGYWFAGALAVGAVAAAVAARRLPNFTAGSEISAFVRNNGNHFAAEEARVLRSINWRAEAALPSVIDARNPKMEKLIIGKISDLERYKNSGHEFMLRWPDDKYDVLSKAQNLSIINRWLKRGGSIEDISPSQVGPGFLNSERAFIASLPKKPGQYLHRMSGETTPPATLRSPELFKSLDLTKSLTR